MNAHTAPIRSPHPSHPIAIALACGAALSVGACGYNHAAAPTYENTPGTTAAFNANTSNTSSSTPTTGTVRTASTNTTNNFDAQTRPTGTPQGPALDPFWIEAAARADRDIWMGNSGAGPVTSGGQILAVQTNQLASTATPNPAAADSVEGLTHVSFAAEGADFDPCLSRDGSFIVYASTQHRPTADIYLKRTDGRTITQLTSDPAHDLMPAISPDGQRIAFASNRSGNWDIYIMSVTGGQAVQLTSDATQEIAPSWSPDGKRIAFSRFGEMSGRWEMWTTEVNSSATAEFIGYGLFPKWCPKGATGLDGRDKILFQRSRERGDRAFSLWTIDYKPGDTSSPTEIVASNGAALINAEWSPDGDRIVYASIDNPGATGDTTRPAISDLWMASIDGSQRVNLTSGKFMNMMPAWSKDGRIYFVSNRSGTTNLWSIGTDKAIQAAVGAPPSTTHNPDRHAPSTAVADVPHEHEAGPAHEK